MLFLVEAVTRTEFVVMRLSNAYAQAKRPQFQDSHVETLAVEVDQHGTIRVVGFPKMFDEGARRFSFLAEQADFENLEFWIESDRGNADRNMEGRIDEAAILLGQLVHLGLVGR